MLPGNHRRNFELIMVSIISLPLETVASFDREAYGAALTLIYLRAMPLAVRNDFHMRIMDRGGLWGGKSDNARWSKSEQSARHAFYSRLNLLHQSAYVIASFDALTNLDNPQPYEAESLILNPWTLSDDEYADGMILLRHGVMPNLNDDADPRDVGDQLGKASSAILKDEYIDYISEFVQETASDLRPLLRSSVRFAARASIIGAIVEALAEMLERGRVAYVRSVFQQDEPRRVFLASIRWGDYVKAAPMRAPSVPAYASGLTPGSN